LVAVGVLSIEDGDGGERESADGTVCILKCSKSCSPWAQVDDDAGNNAGYEGTKVSQPEQ